MRERARLLIIDDERPLRESLGVWLSKDFDVTLAADAGEALEALGAGPDFDLALTDQKMPGMDGIELLGEVRRSWPQTEVIVMTGYGSVQSVEAMRLGAADYLTKPFEVEELDLVIARVLGWRALAKENRELRRQLQGQEDFHGIVARSPAMRGLFRRIERFADAEAPVLVLGENGAGKELVARALHKAGPRADQPFVALACGAVPDTLLEAELFGSEKGAYTGPHATRPGLLERAGTGTLLLDEVGELSAMAQVDFLRVLQEREYRRIGGSKVLPLQARVVAATHRPLEQMVADGRFRQDLFYRLRIVQIVVPPLRERREDIPLLAECFLARYAAANKRVVRRFAPSALRNLMRYAWPGNVRELDGVVHQAALLADGDEVTVHDLPPEGGAHGQGEAHVGVPGAARGVRAHAHRGRTGAGGRREAGRGRAAGAEPAGAEPLPVEAGDRGQGQAEVAPGRQRLGGLTRGPRPRRRSTSTGSGWMERPDSPTQAHPW